MTFRGNVLNTKLNASTKVKFLRVLQKLNEDNFNQLGNYGMPFCKRRYLQNPMSK